jgi:tetratricopeptide (TPR) repeat protein
MDIGRSDLALSTLTQNASLISTHIPSLLLLSMCYSNEGEEYKAISTLLSILSLPKYNQLSSIESNLYLNKSFIEQHLNPDNIDITNTLSYRTYEQHKQNLYKELSTIFETLLQSEQFKNDCDILSSYGILNMIYEHINKAEALFSKVTTLNKNDYTTWNRLGVLYANKKEYSKAIEMYMKALELNPQYPNCLTNVGIAYLNEENYKASAHYFINALQIYKDIPDVWNYLTGVFLAMERDDLVNLTFTKDINQIIKVLNSK